MRQQYFGAVQYAFKGTLPDIARVPPPFNELFRILAGRAFSELGRGKLSTVSFAIQIILAPGVDNV